MRPNKRHDSTVDAMLGGLCLPMVGRQSPDATGMWVAKGSMITGGRSTTGSMRATFESSAIYSFFTTRIARRLMATLHTRNTPTSLVIAFDRKSLGNAELQFRRIRSSVWSKRNSRAVTCNI
jgi:hypothetical protein